MCKICVKSWGQMPLPSFRMPMGIMNECLCDVRNVSQSHITLFSSTNLICIIYEFFISSKSPSARKSRSPKKVRSPRKSRSPRRSPKRARSPPRKSRSPKRSRSPRRRKARSPTPRPTKVHVGRLTRNVNKEHISEIFAIYGSLKNVEMLPDRFHPEFSKGHAYVEYEQPDDAEKAILHMDGG